MRNSQEGNFKVLLIRIPFFSFPYRQFPFTTDQIRVILFRECDIRGRKLLFDSNAVERIPDGPSAGSAAATAHAASASVHHKSIPQAQKCDHCKILYQVGILLCGEG